MCYHLITYVEYGCAHQYPTRRHYIDCNGWNCRLSRFHNPTDHDCDADCTEIILPDQSVVMEVRQEHCNSCLGAIPALTSGANGSNGHRYGAETDTETEDETDTD